MADRSGAGSGAVWPALGLAAMLSYNTWVLWEPLNGDPAVFRGYLSELSAEDQPHDAVFRGGDMLTAALVAVLGVRALRLWRHRPYRRWWLLSAAGLLGFAVATVLDAVFALDCAPSLQPACRAAEIAGTLSSGHYAHEVTSVAAQVGILVSMLAAYLAARGTARPVHRLGSLLVGCVVEVAALVTLLIMIGAGVPRLGYPQAITVLIASLWFAAVGFGVRTDLPDDGSAGRAERKPVHAQ